MEWMIVGYLIIAIIAALVISAVSEHASQWGAGRCVMLGVF